MTEGACDGTIRGIDPRANTTSRPLRRLPTPLVALVAIAVVGFTAFLTGVVQLPDIGGLVEDLIGSLGAWVYLLVPALAFLETGALRPRCA